MIQKTLLFIIVLIVTILSETAAQPQAKYVVTLHDKANSPYNIYRPYEFLSPRAIARKHFYGIAITEEDLPVNPHYLDQMKAQNARIHTSSRWLNSVVISTANDQIIQKIQTLPFVKSVRRIGWYRANSNKQPTNVRPKKKEQKPSSSRYGLADNQIRMLNLHIIHKLGYEGQGRLIAVLDGGFQNVDVMPFFDSLRAEGRLLEGRDFVENDFFPYESSDHGSQVLSTMAANLPELMVGSAPKATYICIKTEETGSETPVEEENWIAGAEFADSLGADVINSSLGYTTFDDTSMNHTHAQLDGKTARASIAASIAAKKGILVVSSAGNSGNDEWQRISAPADAHNILSVAAVMPHGGRADFSSFGPTADGRPNPNLAAQGVAVAVGSINSYDVTFSNGTSFASPILAGAAASLWSAFPEKSNINLIQNLEDSGDNFLKNKEINDETGYGVPDLFRAFETFWGYGDAPFQESERARWYVREPQKGGFTLMFFSLKNTECVLDVRDLLGQQRLQHKGSAQKGLNLLHFEAGTLPIGFHLISLQVGERTYHLKATDLK